MDERVAQLTSGFLERRPAADERDIEEAERRLDYRFPDEYRDLMREWNGGEGFVGEGGYLMLWEVDELPESNEDNNIEGAIDGLVLFGSSGGGLFYAFDRSSGGIVEVPTLPLDEREAHPVAKTLPEFFERLAEQTLDD